MLRCRAEERRARTWPSVLQELRRALTLVPIACADLGRPAKRPAYSVLDCSRLSEVGCDRMPHYVDGLKRYLAEELT